MIIECPHCGAKNSIPDPPKPGVDYHCSACKQVAAFFPEGVYGQSDREKQATTPMIGSQGGMGENEKLQWAVAVLLIVVVVLGVLLYQNWSRANDLEGEINTLNAEINQAEFTFYYASIARQRYGVDDLAEYLNRWQWVEGSYVAGKFDCSEMSAYLEWKLENEGYHTVIVVGENPSGDGRHAWLLVETSVGHYMPVEATAYSIVYWQNSNFNNYFVYDHRFETIQEALNYSHTDFAWWE